MKQSKYPLIVFLLLIALPALSFAGSIEFLSLSPPPLPTPIDDFHTRILENGTYWFHNNTDTTITDFHFKISYPHWDVTGLGGDFFDIAKVTYPPLIDETIIDFYAEFYPGMPHCTKFAIKVEGLPPGYILRATPTPEPATITLLGLGGLVVLRKRRT